MSTATQAPGRAARIIESHKALPTWVQIWMNLILGPVNLATLAFLDQPGGPLVAALALGGMAFTVALVVANGGFVKMTAIGHILPWTALVALLAFAKPEGTDTYGSFLTVLLVTNAISLIFDFNDARIWLQSRRRT